MVQIKIPRLCSIKTEKAYVNNPTFKLKTQKVERLNERLSIFESASLVS